MLLIGLVSVGGFSVLAQRRLRSLGMLGAQGAAGSCARRSAPPAWPVLIGSS